MQALILAGGKGTRLRPLTVYTPKPVVPVVNRPFLLYQIDILRRGGITDITLSLSYQPDKIEHLLGDGSDFGVSLRYVTESSPMGTGGAYRYAAEHLSETTVVLNGDVLTDLDIAKLSNLHVENGSEATIALTPVDDPSKYGVVITDADGNVLHFIEKPKPGDLDSEGAANINAGIYVLEPTVLDLIPKDTNRSFEYDIFPEMLRRKMGFRAFVMTGEYWRDIGTPASYLAAHNDLLSGRLSAFEIDRTSTSEVATRSEIDRLSVVGEGCVIKPGVQIRNSVIGAGTHIEEKSVIENSVIWSHTRIAAAAEIRNAIVGRSCHIGRNAVVGDGAVLGDKTSLTDYTKV